MAIPTPYSYREYTGDGVAKDFAIPFPYLQRVHVHVYLNQTELVEGTDYTWTSGTQIQLTTAPQGPVTGATPVPAELLTVMRQTPEDDQIVQWKDGSYIIADDLNESDLQWLYLIQEHHDWNIRIANNLGALPAGAANTKFWNQLARHADPDKGTVNETANTVDTEDQKRPDPTGLVSEGWVADDKHVATTGAISERLDPIVQDTRPTDPPLGEYRQAGKIWIDDGILQQSYWEPNAGAWVNLGNSGPQGPAGTVTVGTTTTLPAGSSATVANTGTPENAVLDFGVPKGDQGIKGDTGLQGPQGLVGPEGPVGPQGVQGPPGPQGPIGAQGVKGDPGATGATGPQGSIGNAGPQGIQGPTGPQGGAGPTGPKGQDGTSFIIKGSVATQADLPSGATAGDTWFVQNTGDAFSWNGVSWVDIGHLVGPQGPIGPQGPQGVTGPQGTQGVQGIKGDRGLQGVAGAAATLTVGTTTTGAAGSSASVTNSGTTAAAVFDFAIPQGAKGDKGDKGDTGAAGTDGTGVTIKGSVANAAALPTTGNSDGDMWLTQDDGHGHVWHTSSFTDIGQIQGPKGDTGAKGDKGDTGAAGANGAAATIHVGTVTDGTTGAVTNTGTTAAAVFDFVLPKGAKGDKGDQGVKGDTGAQGPIGPQGQKGDAGTGLNVKGSVANAAALPTTGNTAGDAWVTSDDGHMHVWDATSSKWTDVGKIQGPTGPQGPTGATGPAGAAGAKGDTGPAGPKGDTGAQGAAGATGPAGATGAQGPKGDKGDAGAQGVKGDTGAQGATGPQGAKGDTGAKGDKGDTGPAGPTTQATEAAIGAAEIATQTETAAGTDDLRFVTPKKLKGELDKKAPEAPAGTAAGTKSYVRTVTTTGTSALSQAYSWTAADFLPLSGGALTGSVTATERTITAGAFDLATGNFWTCGAIAIPNPTHAKAAMSGLIRLTAAPTGWGGNFKHAGGSATAPTAFPAIVPFYVQSASVILVGKPVEGMA